MYCLEEGIDYRENTPDGVLKMHAFKRLLKDNHLILNTNLNTHKYI